MSHFTVLYALMLCSIKRLYNAGVAIVIAE